MAALRDTGLTVFADDGSGVRVKKIDPDATVTYYVSENHEVIGGMHTTYEFLGNVRFAQARGAEVTYFVQDHLHSTSASLAPDGSLSESGSYLPFGADRTPASVTATSYGFTDQERDRSTGFYNYDARQYDPMASRFLSPDSLLPNPYDPQQLNRYAYARNNPLKYVDPSGHATRSIDFSFTAGAGAAISIGITAAIDDDGNASLLGHYGSGAYGGIGASFSIQTGRTTAKTVDDLAGFGTSVGVSIGPSNRQFTGDLVFAPGYTGHQVGIAKGPGLPVEFHLLMEKSVLIGHKMSIGELTNKIKEFLGLDVEEPGKTPTDKPADKGDNEFGMDNNGKDDSDLGAGEQKTMSGDGY